MLQLALCLLTQLFALSLTAQITTTKYLVKTMDPKQTTAILLDFPNKGVDAGPWDEGFIRVELQITANFPEAVMHHLFKAGRYTLSSYIEQDMFHIQAKNLEKAVSVGGKDLEDQIEIRILTPGYYAVNDGILQKSFPGNMIGEIVGRAASKKAAAKLIAQMRKIKEPLQIAVSFRCTEESTEEKDRLKDQDLSTVEALYGAIVIEGQPLTQ